METIKMKYKKQQKGKDMKKNLAYKFNQKVQMKVIRDKLSEHIEAEITERTARVRGPDAKKDEDSDHNPPEDPNGIYITPRKKKTRDYWKQHEIE